MMIIYNGVVEANATLINNAAIRRNMILSEVRVLNKNTVNIHIII